MIFLEAISKIHLTPNYGVADLLKMLTGESDLKLMNSVIYIKDEEKRHLNYRHFEL